jgi:hypothetical protein
MDYNQNSKKASARNPNDEDIDFPEDLFNHDNGNDGIG